jgi:hypothetical protein
MKMDLVSQDIGSFMLNSKECVAKRRALVHSYSSYGTVLLDLQL